MQLSAVDRRQFCRALGVATIAANIPAWAQPSAQGKDAAYQLVARTDRKRILKAANAYLTLPIRTITSYPSDRSPGCPHDYFSQADYFWPDPKNPNGPYINPLMIRIQIAGDRNPFLTWRSSEPRVLALIRGRSRARGRGRRG